MATQSETGLTHAAKVAPATATIAATMHAGTDAAAQATHQLVDKMAGRAEVSEQQLRAAAGSAQQKLQSSWRTARAKTVVAKSSVDGFMRRHPFASIGIAVGVGVLLAARAKRRAANAVLSSANAARDEAAMH